MTVQCPYTMDNTVQVCILDCQKNWHIVNKCSVVCRISSTFGVLSK